MLDRHTRAYTVLAAVHVATAAVVALDGALVHATCALITALAYGTLCRPSLRHPKVGSPEQ